MLLNRGVEEMPLAPMSGALKLGIPETNVWFRGQKSPWEGVPLERLERSNVVFRVKLTNGTTYEPLYRVECSDWDPAKDKDTVNGLYFSFYKFKSISEAQKSLDLPNRDYSKIYTCNFKVKDDGRDHFLLIGDVFKGSGIQVELMYPERDMVKVISSEPIPDIL